MKAIPEAVVVGLSSRGRLSRLAGLIVEEQGSPVRYLHIQLSDKLNSIFGWASQKFSPSEWAKQNGKDYSMINLSREADAWLEAQALRCYGQFWLPDLRGLFDSEFLVPHLIAWARSQGVSKVCTGHRARITVENEKDYSLCRSRDVAVDQSALLAQNGRKSFSSLVLPLGYLKLGELVKLAVKHEIAKDAEPLADESEHLLDLSKIRALLDTKALSRTKQKGYIIDETQHVLSEHTGLLNFLPGSRTGLEAFPGIDKSFTVLGCDLMKQWLVVGPAEKLTHTKVCLSSRVEWCLAKPKMLESQETLDFQMGFKDATTGQACVKLLADSMLRFEKTTSDLPNGAGRRVTIYRGYVCLGSAQILETYL